MATASPEVLQRISYSVYNDVMNRKKAIILDRKDMAYFAFLMKRKESSGQAGGSTTIKLQKDGGFTMQFWERRDPLAFQEANIELEISFPFTNVHQGFEVVHEDLYKMGYLIKPNGTSKASGAASRLSEDEVNVLADWFDRVLEEWDDSFDRNMEIAWARDGSYNSKAPVGLDGLINLTPTTGTIGGKSRANPLLQHTVSTGLTTTALTGTLITGMTAARREANTFSRGTGSPSGGIDLILVGDSFLDAYVQYARNNGIQYQKQIGGPISKLDLGIPESGYEFEGLPLVRANVFRDLDVLEPSATVPWAKRAYMLNSKSFHFLEMAGLDKFQSRAADASDQRVSRFSMDGRYCLAVSAPNRNALVAVA
jgi:hypothetical protein